MSMMTDPPKSGFRLSQLIYDSRYRSPTIQVVAFLLLVAAIWWLGSNVVTNLAKLGKEFAFSYLGEPAGYDINQRLVEYNNQMSHGRAVYIGLLNTALVAVMGIILATFIGVFVGVLRLSKNWIVSRLAAVYVEGFRNVPLLLWIILIFAFVNESLPHPRDFAKDGGPSMILDSIALTRQGSFIPAPVWNEGSNIVVGVFLLSILAIFGFRRYARKVQVDTGRQLPVFWASLALLIVPAVIAFFVMGQPIGLDIPRAGRFKFVGGLHIRNSLIALWLALSLYTGAFIAEIVRAGILAISKGQSEAAAALGLRSGRAMSLVILPQAMRVIIPPLTSQYLNLTKNSSLAAAVGYMDIARISDTSINQTGRELEGMLILGLVYLGLSLFISMGMNFYNNRVKLKER